MLLSVLLLLPALAGCWLFANAAIWGRRDLGIREHTAVVDLLAVCGCVALLAAMIAGSWDDPSATFVTFLSRGGRLEADPTALWLLAVPVLLMLATSRSWQRTDHADAGWDDPSRRGLRLVLLGSAFGLCLAGSVVMQAVWLLLSTLVAAALIALAPQGSVDNPHRLWPIAGAADAGRLLRALLPFDLLLGFAALLVYSLAAGASGHWSADPETMRRALASRGLPDAVDRMTLGWVVVGALAWRAGWIPVPGWWPARWVAFLRWGQEGARPTEMTPATADRWLLAMLLPYLTLVVLCRLISLGAVTGEDLWPTALPLFTLGVWATLVVGGGTLVAALVAVYESRPEARLTALHASGLGIAALAVLLGLRPGAADPVPLLLPLATLTAGLATMICLLVGLVHPVGRLPSGRARLSDEAPWWWSALPILWGVPLLWPNGGLTAVFSVGGWGGLAWLLTIYGIHAWTLVRLSTPRPVREINQAATEAKVRAAGGRLPVRLLWAESNSPRSPR